MRIFGIEPSFYGILADGMLVLHALFVLFVVGGFMVIWIGYFCGWRFVRNFHFRVAHLAVMGIVAVQALAGIICPLTEWEDQLCLRAGAGERYSASFMQHWLHRILFYEAGEQTFQWLYVLFFILLVLSLWIVRPERKR